MELKTKQDIVNFIRHQTNVELENDPENILNKKRKYLYTSISVKDSYAVFGVLHKYGIRYEKHLNDNYWICTN